MCILNVVYEGYRGTSLIRKRTFLEDPTAGLCLGSYHGPRGWAFSYGRGTPVCTPNEAASDQERRERLCALYTLPHRPEDLTVQRYHTYKKTHPPRTLP